MATTEGLQNTFRIERVEVQQGWQRGIASFQVSFRSGNRVEAVEVTNEVARFFAKRDLDSRREHMRTQLLEQLFYLIGLAAICDPALTKSICRTDPVTGVF